MIELNDELMFAQGGRRYCFFHPEFHDRCVKTLAPAGDPLTRKREAAWYKRLRPLAKFNDNLRELASFQELSRRGEVVWDHFPRCFGIHATTRGDGIVTDLIRDVDRAISITVRHYVRKNGKTPELQSALDLFFKFLLSHHIITRDILDHNLVVQIRPDGLRIVMIDGFGSSEWIPFSTWSKALGRRKILRKMDRFKNRYGF